MMTRNPHERFLELLEYKWVLNNRLSAKFCRNIFPNLIKKEKSNSYSAYGLFRNAVNRTQPN